MPKGISRVLTDKNVQLTQRVATLENQIRLLQDTNQLLQRQVEYLQKQNGVLMHKALQPGEPADFTVLDAIRRDMESKPDPEAVERIKKEEAGFTAAFRALYDASDYELDFEDADG